MVVIMKHVTILAAVIGLAMFVASSQALAAAFIIELHNGREVTSSHVWEEGDEIKCDVPQGIVGFTKALVKRIHTSTLVDHNKSSRSAPSPSVSDANGSTMEKPSPTTATKHTDTRQDVGTSESSPAQTPAGDKGLKAGETQAYHAKKVLL